MTRFTPLWQQAGSYPANYDRALLAALWPVPAAVGVAAAAVSNTMNVSIPPGAIAVPLQSGQHTALCRWDAAEVVTSPAAPASGNSRIDLVICQVRDPQLDAGVNNDFIFVVVAGTPTTGTPVAPAVPTNAAPVCQYTVPGGSANLNGVTVNDSRRGIGHCPVFASTAERDTIWPGAPNGAMCVTLDSNALWHRIGGAWKPGTYSPMNSIRASINDGLIFIEGETKVAVSDAAGNVLVPLTYTYVAAPAVIPINGDPSGGGYHLQLYDNAIGTTYFNVKLIGPSGGGVTNTAVRVNYIAIGRRAA